MGKYEMYLVLPRGKSRKMINQEFTFVSANCLNAINNSILAHISIALMLLKGNTISIATAQRVINTNLSEYEYINFVEG